jgi:hypothetical protein
MSSRTPAKFGLIVLMIVCAQMLWLGNPVIWLWIGSQMSSSQQAGSGPYIVIALGILGSTVVVAMVLARLDRTYRNLTGYTPTVRVRLPWLRSLRDEPGSGSRELTVLDAILVATALAAILIATAWFFFLAGSPLPS